MTIVSTLVLTVGLVVACRDREPGTGSVATTTSSVAGSTSTSSTPSPPSTSDTRSETRVETLEIDGRTRTYRVHIPPALPSGPVPLVVALHGGTGSGQQFQASSGFDAVAAARGFIVVYPDGVATQLGDDRRVWNAGGCCGRAQTARDNVDDVAFIAAVIDSVKGTYAIDDHRVFAVGHSNGAMMSIRLACELSEQIVAIAYQAGALLIDRCEPTLPVSAMAVHGTADRNVPIDGGSGEGLSGVDFPDPRGAIRALAAAEGCDTTAPVTRSPTDVSAVTIEAWPACPDGIAAEFVVVEGANHRWLDAANANTDSPVTAASIDFDMSTQAWTFLASHPRR